jgi:hypothetical protein
MLEEGVSDHRHKRMTVKARLRAQSSEASRRCAAVDLLAAL